MPKLSLVITALVLGIVGCSNETHKESAETPEAREMPAPGPAKTGEGSTRGQIGKRYSNGYFLVNYSGQLAEELTGSPREDAVVLFDNKSKPVYALRGSDQMQLAVYRVSRKSGRELIYAIPMGAAETRVYKGPLNPEEGFPKHIRNPAFVSGIESRYLNASAQDKVRWNEDSPNLAVLELQTAKVGGSSDQSADAGAVFGALADKTAREAATAAEPLIQEANALWKSGRRDEAIEKYAGITRVDSGNPYGHFGLGMQQSAQGGLAPVANGSLGFYLKSDADRGASSAEVARRKLAQETYAIVHQKFLEVGFGH